MNNDEYSHWLYHNISQSMNKYLWILNIDMSYIFRFDDFWHVWYFLGQKRRNAEWLAPDRRWCGVSHLWRRGPTSLETRPSSDVSADVDFGDFDISSQFFENMNLVNLIDFENDLASNLQRHVSNTFTLKQLQSSRKINFQIFQKSQTHYIYR